MLVDISERKAAEEEKALLLRELAHRVNNTFAVILAVAQQTLRTAPSSKAFSRPLAEGFRRWPKRTTFCSPRTGQAPISASLPRDSSRHSASKVRSGSESKGPK